ALANLLSDIVGKEGTIARYGGEEYDIVLPNSRKELTKLFAEKLPDETKKSNFLIQSEPDQLTTNNPINITMSIGVSSAPDDSDDGMAMIRNADRALYIGAKQAGRNKVAAYTK